MDFNNTRNIASDDYDSAKLDLLKLEAIICDGGKISDEAKAMINNKGFVGSTPTLKTVIARISRDCKDVGKMTPEQMQKIVDNAPDSTATHWVETKLGHYYSVEFQSYFRDEDWHDSDYRTEQELIDDYGHGNVFNLNHLRYQLAKHEPMDLRDVDIPHGTIVLEK